MQRNQFTELQLKWIEALESGEYPQCKESLYDGQGYCCLGVAMRVAGHPDADIHGENVLPDEAALRYGLNSNVAEFSEFMDVSIQADGATYYSLAQMNDSGRSFSDIAKFIREHPWHVFKNFDEPGGSS